MKYTLLGVTWASWHNLVWGFAVIGAILFLIYIFVQRQKLAGKLVHKKWVHKVFPGFSFKKEQIKGLLRAVAYVSIFLALLQPQWGKRDEPIEQEGRELFVALDVSRSMLAEDIKPDRLEFAKAKIKRLLKLLPSDRVGLLIFSGSAIVQCPLTNDTGAFRMFLDQIDSETISSGSTAIASVVSKTLDTFERMSARKNKVLVMFTDGEDFSTDLSSIRKRAQDAGLSIFTYGVGTKDGAPVPKINDVGQKVGYEKEADGSVAFTRLNEDTLRSLARETGGKYVSPTQDDTDLKNLVYDVEKYEKEKFEDKQMSTEEDRYPFFLIGAAVALAIEWLL